MTNSLSGFDAYLVCSTSITSGGAFGDFRDRPRPRPTRAANSFDLATTSQCNDSGFEVLGWLQEDPDASAMALLGRLQADHPDRFDRANLRTLHRRVRQWRGIMANKLVYAASEVTLPEPAGMPKMALTPDDPKY